MKDNGLEGLVKVLGSWEGFELVGVQSDEDLKPDALGQPAPQLVLELKPVPDYPKRCSRCGEIVIEIHDVSERRVRDLPDRSVGYLARFSSSPVTVPTLRTYGRSGSLDRPLSAHDYAIG